MLVSYVVNTAAEMMQTAIQLLLLLLLPVIMVGHLI